MIAFFEMFVSFFVKILKWIGGISSNINSAVLLSGLRLTSRKALLVLLVASVLVYVALLVTFFYYLADSIVSLYNMISTLLDMVEQPAQASSSIIQAMFYFMNVSGITAGFNAAFPFVASAITFRLLKALYHAVLDLHEKYTKMFLTVVGIITAA